MQNIFNPTVREQAAYYQYGWVSGPIPVPYGKKEIVWMERMKRTDDHYGKSPNPNTSEHPAMVSLGN